MQIIKRFIFLFILLLILFLGFTDVFYSYVISVYGNIIILGLLFLALCFKYLFKRDFIPRQGIVVWSVLTIIMVPLFYLMLKFNLIGVCREDFCFARGIEYIFFIFQNLCFVIFLLISNTIVLFYKKVVFKH